jgi:hypothetical protein
MVVLVVWGLVFWGFLAQAGAYFEQALNLAQAIGDQATIAHSLNRLGNWHLMAEQPVAARGAMQKRWRSFARCKMGVAWPKPSICSERPASAPAIGFPARKPMSRPACSSGDWAIGRVSPPA